MSTARKFYTGVSLDPEVVEFLADLSRHTERTRSWLINAIVRDQARRSKLDEEAKAAELTHYQPPVIQV